MRGLAVAAVVGLWIAPARADDSAAIRKVLDTQARAIGAHDPVAFRGTFAAHPFAMLPGGYATSAAQAGQAMGRAWWGGDEEHRVVKATVDQAVIGQRGDVAWLTGDLTFQEIGPDDAPVAPEKYRVTELLVRTKGAWKVHTTYWSIARPDDDAAWANNLFEDEQGELDGAPPVAPGTDWLVAPGELARHLSKDAVVLGSAPRERGAGPTAVKLLAGWKRLKFVPGWFVAGGDGQRFAWVAGRVDRPAHTADWDVRVPYWCLALLVRAGDGWEAVSVHYGQTLPLAGLDDARE